MDYKAILNLMKEMNETDLTRLDIEADGIHICMEKGTMIPMTTVTQPSMPQISVSAPTVAEPTVAQASVTAVNEATEKKVEVADGKKMQSPMVGTFYESPSPEKPAFVKVGDKVKKGQTLCIIEAMKLMNEIESEYDGEIVEVLVKNEDMVEFGQPLFIIK